MDGKLIGQALQYYGIDLLNSLKREQQELPSASVLANLESKHPREPEIKDAEFQKKILSFIARKSDLLFESSSAAQEKTSSKNEESINDSYAIMPSVEVFMDVPSPLRRQHFFYSVRPLDCVTGVVTSIVDSGLHIQLLCVDKGNSRDIEDLDIMAFCSAKDLPKLYAHESAIGAFQVKDIVRGIVLTVDAEYEKITLSLHDKSIPDKNAYPRIGLITEEDFPVYFRRKVQIDSMSYEDMLESILGFNNQGNVQTLLSQLGVQESTSFFRCPARAKIPEKEYAEGLRKWQSQKLSHHSVIQGVDMFKQSKYLEAMQHFNRALQIDSENVEALVARGALNANKENFNNAIKDFQEALEINPDHSNAKRYLTETLLTAGKTCEDRRQLDAACDYYSQALKVEPTNREAQEMLSGCQKLMVFQVVASESLMSKDLDEVSRTTVLSKTAEKLKQLINEDKKEKPRPKKKKKQARRSGSGSSGKKRKKKRSSSDESDGSSSSASGDSKKNRKKHRKKKRKLSTSSKQSKKLAGPSESPVAKDKEGVETFVRVIQGATRAAASFLPVSSSEYFSTSTIIPGFDSPPRPVESVRKDKAPPPPKEIMKNVERPAEDRTAKRRDELLMADREKFYKDNKERYKRFRPHSSSSLSSSGSLSPKKKLRDKHKSDSRSSSRSSSKGKTWSFGSKARNRSISPGKGRKHSRRSRSIDPMRIRRSKSLDRKRSPDRSKKLRKHDSRSRSIDRTRLRRSKFSKDRSRSRSRSRSISWNRTRGRSKSLSRSRSRNRSFSRSRSRDRSKSHSRNRSSRSDSRRSISPDKMLNLWSKKKSPSPITGLKELDMYLGGAKNYLNQIKEKRQFDLLDAFMASKTKFSAAGGPPAQATQPNPFTVNMDRKSPKFPRRSRSRSLSKGSPKRRRSKEVIRIPSKDRISSSPKRLPERMSRWDDKTRTVAATKKDAAAKLPSSGAPGHDSGFGKFGPTVKNKPESTHKQPSNPKQDELFEVQPVVESKKVASAQHSARGTSQADFLPRSVVKPKTDKVSGDQSTLPAAHKGQKPQNLDQTAKPDDRKRVAAKSSDSNASVKSATPVVAVKEETNDEPEITWLKDIDLEKEIERRVQERLRQEEEKLRVRANKSRNDKSGKRVEEDFSGRKYTAESPSSKSFDPYKPRMYADKVEEQGRVERGGRSNKFSPKGGRPQGSRGYYRANRGEEDWRGGYHNSQRRSRSSSRDKNRHRSRSPSRERERFRSGSSSRDGNKDKSESRSRELKKRSSSRDRSMHEIKQTSQSHDIYSPEELKKNASVKIEISQSPGEKEKPVPEENSLGSDHESPPHDRLFTSRWESTSSDKEAPPPEPDAEEASPKARQSLTELEKFLVDLKHQKKKQWIAEGKLKNKE